MQIEEIKRLAKIAIDALPEDEIVNTQLGTVLDEVNGDIAEEFNREMARLEKIKPSELVRLSKKSLKDVVDEFSSDVVKGRIILSTIALSGDAMIELSPLDKVSGPSSSQLNEIMKLGDQGYSAQVLAHHFNLVVEDVEEFLKAQGIE